MLNELIISILINERRAGKFVFAIVAYVPALFIQRSHLSINNNEIIKNCIS